MVVGELLRLTHRLANFGVNISHVGEELLLEGKHQGGLEVVEAAGGTGVEDHRLVFPSHRHVLTLLEQLDELLSAG